MMWMAFCSTLTGFILGVVVSLFIKVRRLK
jgi:hypothetical protein